MVIGQLISTHHSSIDYITCAVDSILRLPLVYSSLRAASLWLLQERFVTAKYVEKRYAMTAVPATLGTPQTALWEACEGRSIRYAASSPAY